MFFTLCGLVRSLFPFRPLFSWRTAFLASHRRAATLLLLLSLGGCQKAHIAPPLFDLHSPPNAENLAELPDPIFQSLIKKERAYSLNILAPQGALQRRLYRELTARSLASTLDPPVKIGSHCYYSRLETGARYPSYFRKPCGPNHLESGSQPDQEEVLLDLNSVGWGQPEMELGLLRISPNQQRIAFTLKKGATGSFSLYITNLDDRTTEEVPAADVAACEWSNDNQRLYYTTSSNGRPYRLYEYESPMTSRSLAEPSHIPHMLYEETNPAAWLSLSRSEDGNFLLLTSGTQTTSDVYFIDASSGSNETKLERIQPKKEGVFYTAHPHKQDWLIRTNEGADNYQIIKRSRSGGQESKETVLVPGSEIRTIENVLIFNDFAVLFERQNGLPGLSAIDLENSELFEILAPDRPCKISKALGSDFHLNLLHYSVSCWTMPRAIYQYDLSKRQTRLIHQDQFKELPQDWQTDFITRRLFARSADGVPVPISLITKRTIPLNGANPLVLHVYGAYGLSSDPTFSPELFSLLERGVIYAVAHVRGGGELGPIWHREGRLLKKKNSIDDFLAAAKYLVHQGYTSPDRLAAHGRSAGGLIVAAAANIKPELFRALVLEAPFLDVLGVMLNTSLPSTPREYEEWGNPQDPQAYRYMASYSPLVNIHRQQYPFVLVSHGLLDEVIPLSQTLSWVYLLRSKKSDNRPVLFRASLSGSHSGEANQYDELGERAWQYAFLLSTLGVED